jgi:hypothetical protein
MLIVISIWKNNKDLDLAEVVGYITIVLGLSTIFFGIKSYRDQQSGGSITFGKAFVVGLSITLVASVIYVIGWKVYSSLAMPDYMEQYAEHSVEELRSSGASPARIAEEVKKMQEYREMYKNPVFELAMTFMEVFPVGLIVTLICSGILRTRRPADDPIPVG